MQVIKYRVTGLATNGLGGHFSMIELVYLNVQNSITIVYIRMMQSLSDPQFNRRIKAGSNRYTLAIRNQLFQFTSITFT